MYDFLRIDFLNFYQSEPGKTGHSVILKNIRLCSLYLAFDARKKIANIFFRSQTAVTKLRLVFLKITLIFPSLLV
jgi:hypothetical protein